MHPRQQEIEAERRLKPIGQNCAVNVLRDGYRHVQPFPGADPEGQGVLTDPPYFSEYPFTVTRQQGLPDIVIVPMLAQQSAGGTSDAETLWNLLTSGTPTDFVTDAAEPDPIDLPLTVACTMRFTLANGGQFSATGPPYFGLPPISPLTEFYVVVSAGYLGEEIEYHEQSILFGQTVEVHAELELRAVGDPLEVNRGLTAYFNVYNDSSRSLLIYGDSQFINGG